ncbi:Tex family protein, partial [Gammaproteobacteria bacterium]|nr:Tex family protein [Gammaproteobacteria bacterium]
MTPYQRIADELGVRLAQVQAAVGLLDEGATVPFIARYRKEATGGLDDGQLRQLAERYSYLSELELRREAVLTNIREQGRLDASLEQRIRQADSKARLEDLYLPYKTKRRTKGQIAIENGLEALADQLLADPSCDPQKQADHFITADVSDATAALEGARAILMERFAEDAELRHKLREWLHSHALLQSRVMSGKDHEAQKFSDYFEYHEPLARVPSHRALALLRGRKEGFLALSLVESVEAAPPLSIGERLLAQRHDIQHLSRAADDWLAQVLRFTWRVKLLPTMESDLLGELRERAEVEAIRVFADNLRDLLMAAPAGPMSVLGLDPGFRTGCKLAVVDTATIYPHPPQKQWNESLQTMAALCKKHAVRLVAIGNGTASRESEKLVRELQALIDSPKITPVMISEAGASVYSASELAAKEFPELDVTLRGAVSIARRLQDPLAELVKIEAKAIGVGQYQHDVNQSKLARQLNAVVEDCVNAVGVDLNTASAALLSHVSGLSATLAEHIVHYRDQNGAFRNRQQLLKVSRIGDKAFEQSAGFLRIRGGDQPLDASAVHPESYSLVERIAATQGCAVAALVGEPSRLKGLQSAHFADEQFGELTVADVLAELGKPGRDPRPEFKVANFSEGIEKIGDLKPEMMLEGVVSNVTDFGAFVDIGVHQDGLVHISQLADRFVKDPREVVKAGDIVRVRVVEVDPSRKRIALSMKKQLAEGEQANVAPPNKRRSPDRVNRRPAEQSPTQSALADAFR